MEKTILVAIDGSVYSANSLDYLARLFAADSSLRPPDLVRFCHDTNS